MGRLLSFKCSLAAVNTLPLTIWEQPWVPQGAAGMCPLPCLSQPHHSCLLMASAQMVLAGSPAGTPQ